MDLDKLEEYLEQAIDEQNRRGLPEFEGYSPMEMQSVLYDPFGKGSPIRLKKMKPADYEQVPLLNQMKYIMHLVQEEGELKLTAQGNLPVKVVADIYDQGYIKDDFIERGISKLYREEDTLSINLPKILLEISGLVKKRNNTWSLTKRGKRTLSKDHALLRILWTTFGTKFNWGYYDGYESEQVGRLGFGFTLILLDKYGAESREDSFYAEKYLRAFPFLLKEMTGTRFRDRKQVLIHCYSLRTFDRFLNYLGLTEVEQEQWTDPNMIVRTPLFSKMLRVYEPGKIPA